MNARFLPTLALFLALAGAALARPTVTVEEVRVAGKADNVGDTRFARIGGRWWFLKKDVPASRIQRYGNLEAELLVARVLTRFGYRVPQARTVHVAGEEGVFLQTEIVDEAFGGRGEVHRLDEWLRLEDRGRVDPARVALLQVLDVVLGNGDRHFGNLFLATDRAEAELLPIDNNLALADETVALSFLNLHFTPGFDGLAEEVGQPGYQDMVQEGGADRSGTLPIILERNPLYADVWTGGVGRRPKVSRLHVPLAHQVRRRLDDATLTRLVGALADEDLLVPDPATRRKRILSTLRRRRDELPEALRAAAESHDPAARRGSMLLAYGLPGAVLQRLPLSEAARHFVASRMFEGGDFQPLATYGHLRAAGLGRLQAREVLRHLCEATSTAFPLKQLLTIDEATQRSTYAAALAEFRAGHSDAARPVASPESRRPRFLKISPQGVVLDGRERPVAPSDAPEVLRWLRTQRASGELPADAPLELERDVFLDEDADADADGARAYRLWIAGAEAAPVHFASPEGSP